jgi:hypothetical protein
MVSRWPLAGAGEHRQRAAMERKGLEEEMTRMGRRVFISRWRAHERSATMAFLYVERGGGECPMLLES